MYAHTKPGMDRGHWEPLIDHLENVATQAGRYAAAFGAEELGRAAGWWHDLGKASRAFQEDVLGQSADEALSDDGETVEQPLRVRLRVDHSTAGARHAVDTLGDRLGCLIAYGIAGHHGRLPDWHGDGSSGTLRERLDPHQRKIKPIDPPEKAATAVDPRQATPRDFKMILTDPPKLAFQCAFLTRMLYSALVDADRLETERFCNPETAALRPAGEPDLADLLDRLNTHLDQLQRGRSTDPSPVDTHRAEVLAACRGSATKPPGIFSLTVPTGGGKTLASMAFALEHAKRHGQQRVVYALPYTSIIEQTAAILSEVFGEDQVLEHHSNLDAERRTNRSITAELSAENFDAPVVVTTNNQLFESLFSAHGSTCRKLHRLANSVIVLDEAQAVPPRLLRPTLAVLEELVHNYRCTVVLCTATQPAVTRREGFPIGLEHVTEIVPEPAALYEAMRRVQVVPLHPEGPVDDDTLAEHLDAHDQVLCIVNTRKHAAELTRLLIERDDSGGDSGGVIHLSAAMCPEHRSQLVVRIKQALTDNRPCRVVSTQVIEAGVDVDFPVVYRALAGFDSIAQAAGRCNREGRREVGEVFLFTTEHQPALSLQPNVHAASELMDRHPDPLALDAIEDYFRLVYWKRQHEGKKPWDHRDVMGCFQTPTQHQFREADARFQWIDTQTTPVIVPFGETGRRIVEHLQTADEPDWQLLRSAQRYSVSVYENQLAQLIDNTAIVPCFPDKDGQASFWALTNPEAYDGVLGLRFDVSGWDVEGLTGL